MSKRMSEEQKADFREAFRLREQDDPPMTWKKVAETLSEKGILDKKTGKPYDPAKLKWYYSQKRVDIMEGADLTKSRQEPTKPAKREMAYTGFSEQQKEGVNLIKTNIAERPKQEPVPVKTTIRRPEPELPKWLDEKATKELLSIYQSGKLTEMIGWYESMKGAPMQTAHEAPTGEALTIPTHRPLIPGKRKNTGVFINEKLLDMVKAKLKTEQERVGTSLSQLVELLLWSYAGSPDLDDLKTTKAD